MNQSSTPARSQSGELHHRIAHWSLRIVILSVLIVGVATLYPFRPNLDAADWWSRVQQGLYTRTSRSDVIANILLFMPLGFGLGGLWLKRRLPTLGKVVLVVAISAGLSTTVELLQALLPSRETTLADVFTNSLGGAVGYLVFHSLGWRLFAALEYWLEQSQRLLARLSLLQLCTIMLSYLAIAVIGLAVWQGSSLQTWEPSALLTVGKHRFGMGSWSGSIAYLHVRDRALSTAEVEQTWASLTQPTAPAGSHLLASYRFTDVRDRYPDQAGQAPDLIWHDQTPQATATVGIPLSEDYWLTSAQPMARLSQSIQQSSQLTFSTQVATAQPDQGRGFHRIAVLSGTQFGSLGDLTLAQSNTDLVFWLRTGRGRGSPQGFVPQVFANTQPHTIVATYAGYVLRLYIDRPDQVYVFDFAPDNLKIVLYLLVLSPLGLLLGCLANRFNGQPWLYAAVVMTGIAVPSLVLEVVLAQAGERQLRLANWILGVAITGGAFLLSQKTLPFRWTRHYHTPRIPH